MQKRDWLGILGAVLLGAGLGGAGGAAAPWTEALTQQALASGAHMTLPLHLSVILGLSTGDAVEVRQLVRRADNRVHTFNVSVANHSDIVIFRVDERTQATVAYFLGPGATLRKAVFYHSGVAPHELSAAEARTGLAREARFWSGGP